MGIRFEKDTILNWINEMGKFLRLLVDKWETGLVEEDKELADRGYLDFFGKEKDYFLSLDVPSLEGFINELDPEQIRPLAQLMMYDGLLTQNKNLLEKAKWLFEENMRRSGNFSFEDFDLLKQIEQNL